MKMIKRHYREDFLLALQMVNPCGVQTGVPDFDFMVKIRSDYAAFTAGRKDGALYNCRPGSSEDELIVMLDSHGLGPCEELIAEITYFIPDPQMPDGVRTVVRTHRTGIHLSADVCECNEDESLEFSVLLPYIKGDKGDPFTYGDFTEEQLAELQKPAVDAANRVDKSIENAIKATADANSAAQSARDVAKSAEDATKNAEALNKDVSSAEKQRIDAENDRAKDEALRKQNEQSRISAESERARNENQRIASEADRVAAENARISDAEKAISNAESAASMATNAAANANSVADSLAATVNSKQNQLVDSEDITVNENQLMLTPNARTPWIQVVEHVDSECEILPNIYHRWGEMEELTISLAEGREDILNEYMIEFISGESPTALTFVDDVVFPNPLEIKVNCAYQISIVNGLGLVAEYELD